MGGKARLWVLLLVGVVIPGGLGWLQISRYAAMPRLVAAESGPAWLGTDRAPLRDGRGLAMLPDKSILVAEAGAGRVLAYAEVDGEPSPRVFAPTDSSDPLETPVAVASAPLGLVYVLDGATGTILRYSAEGRYEGSSLLAAPGDGCLAIDLNGSLLLSETGAGTVKRFRTDLELDPSWGDSQSGSVVFKGEVGGLAVSGSSVFVSLPTIRQIVRLEVAGRVVERIPTIGNVRRIAAAPGGGFLAADEDTGRIWTWLGEGHRWGLVTSEPGGETGFSQPRALLSMRDGQLAVLDAFGVQTYRIREWVGAGWGGR